jgi:hypothetical protein
MINNMTYKQPRVGMIYLEGDHISEQYKAIVSQSWINGGFSVDYYRGVTPSTINDSTKELKFGKKGSGRNRGRDFTETEKSIWYSHLMMWDIASRKANPFIIIEHDVLLLEHINQHDVERYSIMGLCHNGLLSKNPHRGYRVSAGGAYMLKNDIAKKMIDELPKEITTNSDAYIHNYITRYGAFKHSHSTQLYLPKLGTTIDHD